VEARRVSNRQRKNPGYTAANGHEKKNIKKGEIKTQIKMPDERLGKQNRGTQKKVPRENGEVGERVTEAQN